MTPFEFNEQLKERCILLGAKGCFTKYLDETQTKRRPVWFNVIELPLHMHKNYVMVVCGLVDSFMEEFEFLGIEDMDTDVSLSEAGRFIIYNFYYDFDTFVKKDFSVG